MPARRSKRRQSFIERSVVSLADAASHALFAEELAHADGLLQRLDPRVKVVGLLALIIVAAMARHVEVILAIFVLATTLALLSKVSLRTLATREWIGVFIFTACIALPAIFITPGHILYRVPLTHWPITEQGLRSALYLITRVETEATLALLLILCTTWTHVLKALRVFYVPVVFVVILGMTYRYIFVLLQTAQDMFEARQSRLVGQLEDAERRRMAAASVGVLLGKSLHLSHEVFLAMQSRGFQGEVYTLDDFLMQPRDWLALGGFLVCAGLAFWWGR